MNCRISLALSVAGVILACVASAEPLSSIREGFALAAEQRSGTIVALDASQPGAPSFVWSWDPNRDPGIDRGHLRLFGAPSECKVVGTGKDRAVLMADSLGGFARIPFATGKADCYGMVGGNPHSVEQLPGGHFVVTASSMSHCLTLVEVSEHPFAPDVQPKKSYPLADAHGVVWDAGRTCLWAIGVSNIVRYAWHPERAELQAVRSCDFLNAAGRDGHDLQLGSDGRLRFTTGSVIACFDPENESFEVRDRRKDVKSDSVHADFGDLLVIVREVWWTDRLIVKRDGHEYEVGPYPEARFYKARWIGR